MLSILVWSLLWDRIQTSLTLNFCWWGSPCPSQTPLTSPIPFLFQYDYLGDRRPVPAGLFPYNYPPPPTVHDKMVRPLLPFHFPSGSLLPGWAKLGATQGCSVPDAWPIWFLAASGYLLPPGQDSNTNTECGVRCSFSVTQGRGAGTRSGSM